jgi:hypothetical protein
MARVSTITIGLAMYQALEAYINKTIKGTFYPPQTVNTDGGDVAVRGADATTEDAVLTVSSATAGEVQTGKARLNIYEQDIDCGLPNKVADTARLQEIAEKAEELLSQLNGAETDYLFDLAQAPTAISVPGKAEHFVNFTFSFKRITFNE